MTGRERIAQLKLERPDITVRVIRTWDHHAVWEGDEPLDDRFECFDHEVVASTIRGGELLEGHDYLGDSWYDLDDASRINKDDMSEISGYLLQMVGEAVDELDSRIAEWEEGNRK